MARTFEPLSRIELYDGNRLVGVYLPGLRYSADGILAQRLDVWLMEGSAKLVEPVAQARIGGAGEVR